MSFGVESTLGSAKLIGNPVQENRWVLPVINGRTIQRSASCPNLLKLGEQKPGSPVSEKRSQSFEQLKALPCPKESALSASAGSSLVSRHSLSFPTQPGAANIEGKSAPIGKKCNKPVAIAHPLSIRPDQQESKVQGSEVHNHTIVPPNNNVNTAAPNPVHETSPLSLPPASRWHPLPSFIDIISALETRPSELNYNGLLNKLTDAYGVDFHKLSELLPRYKCQNITSVKDPTHYFFISESSLFNHLYIDNYCNLRKHTSELYLLVNILEAERCLVNPDSPPPAYCEKNDENHGSDQSLPMARSIISMFFINLLVHFKNNLRMDFLLRFSNFINQQENTSLKNNIATLTPIAVEFWNCRKKNKKPAAETYLKTLKTSLDSSSHSLIDKNTYDHLFKLIFSKHVAAKENSPEDFIYPLYDFDQCWVYMKRKFSNIWCIPASSDYSNDVSPDLKLSLIKDDDIPALKASSDLRKLLQRAGDSLAFDFQGLVHAFGGINREIPCVRKPIHQYMLTLPQELKKLKQAFLDQHDFHDMDRNTVFLLTWLLNTELEVTGISSQPPSYDESIVSHGQHDTPIFQNAEDKRLKIKQVFIKSLHQYLIENIRMDMKRRLVSFCKENGYKALLPVNQDSTAEVNQRRSVRTKRISPVAQPLHSSGNIQKSNQTISPAAPEQNQPEAQVRTPIRPMAKKPSQMTNSHSVLQKANPRSNPHKPEAHTEDQYRKSRNRKKDKNSFCIIV